MRERLRFERELQMLSDSPFETLRDRDQMDERCKQEWLRFLERFPTEVREALTKLEWNSAIVLAIHSGVRDIAVLRKLLFFGQYGEQRGYCPLTSAQADAQYRQLWNQLPLVIRPFLARPSPPLAQKGGVKCLRIERKLDAPKPDNPGLNLTGRYEHQHVLTGETVADYTYAINQAGRHLEGIVNFGLRPDGRKIREFHKVYGDLQSDGSFLVFSHTKPDDFFGSLRFDQSRRKLIWETGSNKDELLLTSPSPTLMEKAFSDKGYLKKGGVIYQREWFPLTQTQINRLKTKLEKSAIEKYLKAYFVDGQENASYYLDQYFKSVFADKLNGIQAQDARLGRLYAKIILTDNKWTYKQLTMTHFDWIRRMYNIQTRQGGGFDFLKGWLNLPAPDGSDPSATAKKHTYQVTLSLTGVSLFASYYTGKVTFEKTNEPKWKEGKVTYDLEVKGFGLEDIKIADDVTGKAETDEEWFPPEIPGDIRIALGSISAGASGTAGFMHVFGSGALPLMHVLFADTGLDVTEPSLSLDALFGEIFTKNFKGYDASRATVKTDYAVQYGLQEDTHFCLGSAFLTEDARQALRIVCANELSGFRSPTSKLEITGHTDRVDTEKRHITPAETGMTKEQRNVFLSELRTKNTLQAIRDILGNDFKIPAPLITLTGKGEAEAKRDHRPNNKPDPRYRRVDVFLNSRLLISLRPQ
jgi:outer membrane protein OmpA-like peptidoglycan-associated protein